MTKNNCLSYQIFHLFNQLFWFHLKFYFYSGAGEEKGGGRLMQRGREWNQWPFFGDQKKKQKTIGLLPLYNNVNKLQWSVIQIQFLEVKKDPKQPKKEEDDLHIDDDIHIVWVWRVASAGFQTFFLFFSFFFPTSYICTKWVLNLWPSTPFSREEVLFQTFDLLSSFLLTN